MTIIYDITKCFEFEACHKLNLTYDSPCAKIHGHSYKVELTIKSRKLDTNGMVLDFSELKPIKTWVDENWDHGMIMSKSDPDIQKYRDDKNIKLFESDYSNITAENMCVELIKQVETMFQNIEDHTQLANVDAVEVVIWETSNNKATATKLY